MLTNELFLVLGLVIGLLTVPAILSAIKEGIAPRGAAVAFVISGGLITYAVYNSPGGISVNELPDIFNRVVRSMMS